jgi:hypothetical protein
MTVSSLTKEMLATALQRLEALQDGEIAAVSDEQLKQRADEVAELALKAIATCVKYDLSTTGQSTILGLGTLTFANGQVHFNPEEHVLQYAALKKQDFIATQQALRNAFVQLLYLANRLLPEVQVNANDTVDPAMYPASEDRLLTAIFGGVAPNRFDQSVSRLVGHLIDQLVLAGLDIGLSPTTTKPEAELTWQNPFGKVWNPSDRNRFEEALRRDNRQFLWSEPELRFGPLEKPDDPSFKTKD